MTYIAYHMYSFFSFRKANFIRNDMFKVLIFCFLNQVACVRKKLQASECDFLITSQTSYKCPRERERTASIFNSHSERS